MKGFLSWISEHAFDLFSAVGIIASLVFTAASFRDSVRSRRTDNLLKLTEQHRAIWEKSQGNPALVRIRDPKANLASLPVTVDEAQFVTFLILHIYCWYRVMLERGVTSYEGMESDIKSILSQPVPRHVWERGKVFQDPDFQHFIDELLNN